MIFRNKTVLITGAASGIGLATARAFAVEGARLILADQSEMTGLVEDVSSSGATTRAIQCDVANPESVDALFQQIDTLDVVVNCAGILLEGSIQQMSFTNMSRQIDVNLKGTFLIAQGAARHMANRGAEDPGRMILIASELAHRGRAEMSAYCASKAGVIGLVRALSRECAPGILVNAVAPGPVDTPMLDMPNMSAELLAQELDNPLQRVGQPGEIASAILFLAGPGGTLMTGQTVCPSGGAVML